MSVHASISSGEIVSMCTLLNFEKYLNEGIKDSIGESSYLANEVLEIKHEMLQSRNSHLRTPIMLTIMGK